MLYKARNKVIKFYDDCSLMLSEAKNKSKNNINSQTIASKYKITKKVYNNIIKSMQL